MSEPNLGNLKKLEAFATMQTTKAMKDQVGAMKEQNTTTKKNADLFRTLAANTFAIVKSLGTLNKTIKSSLGQMINFVGKMNNFNAGLTAGSINVVEFANRVARASVDAEAAIAGIGVNRMSGDDDIAMMIKMQMNKTGPFEPVAPPQVKTGRGTAKIGENPVEEMLKNWKEFILKAKVGGKSLQGLNDKRWKGEKNNASNFLKRGLKPMWKQTKKTTKEYTKMSWEMAAVNLTMGPFLEFLQSFMAPFQSLGTMMGAMGSILSTAFVPGIIEVNENFAKAIPLMWKVADSLTEVLSGFIVNGTAIGLLSQYLEKLAGKTDKTEEAIRKLKNQMEKATVKVGKFRLAIYNGISNINWKPMMSGMASAMKSAAKTAIDLIEWGGAFVKLTEEEGGILPALKVVVDGIDWAAAFEKVPLMMVTGLLKWFITDDADSWDLSDVAFWFVNKIAKGITDESMDFTGIAQNILNGIKVSLVKNKLNLSVADVIGVIV